MATHNPGFIGNGQTFVISSHLDHNLVLDIDLASKQDGAVCQLWPRNNGANQLFFFAADHSIINVGSGKVLDINGGLHEGHHLTQFHHHGGENQKFRLNPDESISVGNFVLDVEGGRASKGGRVIAYRAHGGQNQKWRLIPTPLRGTGQLFFIVSELNPKFVLDVEGESKSDSAKVHIWEKHGRANQQWRINFDGTITSAHSNKVLDINGGIGQGHHLTQFHYHGGENQKFRFNDDGSISVGHFVIDVEGNRASNGTKVHAYAPHGGKNQKWAVVPVQNKPFVIASELNHNLVLDISGSSKDNGAAVHIWERHGGANQLWYLNPDYTIRSVHSEKYLDINGGIGQGHVLHQWSFHGGENQLFRFNGDGTISLGNTSLVLDVEGGNARNGGKVFAYPKNGGQNQKWVLLQP